MSHAITYEIAKNIGDEFTLLAVYYHCAAQHPGTFGSCSVSECAHRREKITVWRDAVASMEDPNFARRYNSVTGRFE